MKYRLTMLNTICLPEDQWGLGIKVLDIKNMCLLTKCKFKLLLKEGVWRSSYTISTYREKHSCKF
jgi:hypothetical protein